MTPLIRLALLIVFLVAQAIELGLIFLNLRAAARNHGVPPALKGLMPRRVAERARRYALVCARQALVRGAVDAACTGWLLFGGVLPWLDRRLGENGIDGAHRFVVFLAAISLALVLLDLPFAWWRARAVDEHFGLAPDRPGRFLVDRAFSLASSAAIGLPLLYVTWACLSLGGDAWWLWLFGAVTALRLFMQWAWPALLSKRLARARPVTGGPLPGRLEALTAAAGLQTAGVFVVEAARRSGHANAGLVGLFRPYLLLDDRLLSRLTLDEVAAVSAHEIGHFRLRHQQKRLVVSMALTFSALALAAALLPWRPLYLAFGFEGPCLHAAVALVSLAGTTLAVWTSPISAAWSRRHELDADAYAVRLSGRIGPLASALQRLSADNLSNPWPHPWYVAWKYSHPPLADRLVSLVRAAEAR